MMKMLLILLGLLGMALLAWGINFGHEIVATLGGIIMVGCFVWGLVTD